MLALVSDLPPPTFHGRRGMCELPLFFFFSMRYDMRSVIKARQKKRQLTQMPTPSAQALASFSVCVCAVHRVLRSRHTKMCSGCRSLSVRVVFIKTEWAPYRSCILAAIRSKRLLNSRSQLGVRSSIIPLSLDFSSEP